MSKASEDRKLDVGVHAVLRRCPGATTDLRTRHVYPLHVLRRSPPALLLVAGDLNMKIDGPSAKIYPIMSDYTVIYKYSCTEMLYLSCS